MTLSELPIRLLSKGRRCGNQHCKHALDWTQMLRPDRGIEFQGQWLCSEDCFSSVMEDAISTIPEPVPGPVSSRGMPLGLVLLSRGYLTHTQLNQALQYQQSRRPAKRIGDVLKELGVANDRQITRALAERSGCPVFTLQPSESSSCGECLPLHFLEVYRMLPVHFSPGTRTLFLGFTERVSYALLYAVEQMLGIHAEPCLIESSLYERQYEIARNRSSNAQIVIETAITISEAVRLVLNYARQLQTASVRVASCGEYLWLRLTPTGFDIVIRFPQRQFDTHTPVI
ncbi:MAG TPA: hypothetical protein VKW78_14670 [Terriglobales bacterium]|nr:hypothetical protein [Terriglobales bacterium]